MAAKSFIEILEERIRKDLRAEFEAEFATPAPRSSAPRASAAAAESVEAWILRRMGGPADGIPRASSGQASGAYAARAPRRERAQATAAEPVPVVAAEPATAAPQDELRLPLDSSACLLARETFRRLGVVLPERCSERDVKSAFRKLALKTHPDRHAQAGEAQARRASETFAALVEASDALLEAFAAAA